MDKEVLLQLLSPGYLWPMRFAHSASNKRFNDLRNDNLLLRNNFAT